MKKIAAIGHLLDRYDQALFALLASTLAPLFFPFEDPLYSLIATFCLLPLGLLAKPLGAYVFGRLGDKSGYQKSFSLTLMGLAMATGAMGVLPTYEQVGIFAPILLALCRLLQNFFSAGETTGAVISALSQAEEKKKTWVGSLIDASGMLGTVLGSVICTVTLSWGGDESWRFLFLTGALGGFIGWWVRKRGRRVVEKKQNPGSFFSLWRYKREVLSIAAVSGFSYANYYLLTLFFPSFLPLVGIAEKSDVMFFNTWMLGADLCLLPLVGALIQNRARWIRRTLFVTALLAVPLYQLLDPSFEWGWAVAWAVFMILGVCVAAPFHAWSFDLAPKEHRFAVHAMGRALGSRLLGAPAPAVALWLYQQSGGCYWMPAILVMATAVLAIVGMRQSEEVGETEARGSPFFTK